MCGHTPHQRELEQHDRCACCDVAEIRRLRASHARLVAAVNRLIPYLPQSAGGAAARLEHVQAATELRESLAAAQAAQNPL